MASKSLCLTPGELVDQVHRPVPLHARQNSTRPEPPHELHWTLAPPVSLPTRTSVPQYVQYAF